MLKTNFISYWCQKRTKFTLSKFFQPFDVIPYNQDKKHNPQEDSISARLMTSYGIVRQAGPGTYHLLPMGVRAQNKLENIIDRELEKIGCLKMSLPHITQGQLWKNSGRLETIGDELVTFKDRHERLQVLSPTHEESVTDIFKSLPFTAERDLPIKLYQIGSKFRDEMRPKFGLIRANEFTMKDLYTFDKDIESAKRTYEEVSEAYRRIFTKIGVPYVVVTGDTGNIGGSMSHEYHFPASIGQDTIMICDKYGSGYNKETLEKDQTKCPSCDCEGKMKMSKGIEVGHTFLLGDKYSRSGKATYKNDRGDSLFYQMGCYGIGVSRLLASCLEVRSTPTELRWPEKIAPFSVVILAPKGGSKQTAAGDILEIVHDAVDKIFKNDVILDDRDKLSVGKKLREAKKTGYPYIVLFGKKSIEADPKIELHNVNSGEMFEFSPSEIVDYLSVIHKKLHEDDDDM